LKVLCQTNLRSFGVEQICLYFTFEEIKDILTPCNLTVGEPFECVPEVT